MRASTYASGTPTTKPMTVAMTAAETVSQSERRTSSWRRASPRRPAPAPTIMLAAGSSTKASSSAPATAHSAQKSDGRKRIIAAAGVQRRACGGPGIDRVPVFPEDAHPDPPHARLTPSGAAAALSSVGGVSTGWCSCCRMRRPCGPSRKAANSAASPGSGAFAGIVKA